MLLVQICAHNLNAHAGFPLVPTVLSIKSDPRDIVKIPRINKPSVLFRRRIVASSQIPLLYAQVFL